MADGFDPYYKWLAIPPEEQPPNHYRLLGTKIYESDPDVIETAADLRMTHIRTFQTGRRAAESEDHASFPRAADRVLAVDSDLPVDTQRSADAGAKRRAAFGLTAGSAFTIAAERGGAYSSRWS